MRSRKRRADTAELFLPSIKREDFEAIHWLYGANATSKPPMKTKMPTTSMAMPKTRPNRLISNS